MFRVLAILGLLLGLLAIVVHAVDARRRSAPARDSDAAPLTRLQRFSLLLTALGLLAMAATGFLSAIGQGPGSLGGWLLWMHLSAAPLIVLGLSLMVLTWAERCRFSLDGPAPRRSLGWLGRFYFWMTAVLGLATILPMLLSMTPLFASELQTTLYALHRYAALLLTMIGMGLAYLGFRAWRQGSQ